MANIFIADDDILLIDLLRFRLERTGHSVTSATDGELALELILKPPGRPAAGLSDAGAKCAGNH